MSIHTHKRLVKSRVRGRDVRPARAAARARLGLRGRSVDWRAGTRCRTQTAESRSRRRASPAATTWTMVPARQSARESRPGAGCAAEGRADHARPTRVPTLRFGKTYVPMTELGPYKATRRGELVRQALPRPAHGVGRDLRHVRNDRRAPDAADSELRAGHQPAHGGTWSLYASTTAARSTRDRLIDLSYVAAYKLGIIGSRQRHGRGGEHPARARRHAPVTAAQAPATSPPARRTRARLRPPPIEPNPLASTCSSARSACARTPQSLLARVQAEAGLARRCHWDL